MVHLVAIALSLLLKGFIVIAKVMMPTRESAASGCEGGGDEGPKVTRLRTIRQHIPGVYPVAQAQRQDVPQLLLQSRVRHRDSYLSKACELSSVLSFYPLRTSSTAELSRSLFKAT
jgi:hypothetical protein